MPSSQRLHFRSRQGPLFSNLLPYSTPGSPFYPPPRRAESAPPARRGGVRGGESPQALFSRSKTQRRATHAQTPSPRLTARGFARKSRAFASPLTCALSMGLRMPERAPPPGPRIGAPLVWRPTARGNPDNGTRPHFGSHRCSGRPRSGCSEYCAPPRARG